MSISSYDELMKQVECLKSENTILRRELQDNSSHLSKLEYEAVNMKDVLAHLQTAMRDDLETSLQLGHAPTNDSQVLDQNSNSAEESPVDNVDMSGPAGVDTSSVTSNSSHKSHQPDTSNASKKRNLELDASSIYSVIQDLDQERSALLQSAQEEANLRKWYLDQLDAVAKKAESLPMSETYNLQTDMTRRQLEYESQRIRDLLQENLGTAEQMAQRHEARVARIRMIEAELMLLQQRHREQEFDARANGSDATFGEDSLSFNNPNKSVNIATQTVEAQLPEDEDGAENSSVNQTLASLYHGAWPIDKGDGSFLGLPNQETASVMSFHSSNVSASTGSRGSRTSSNHQLGTKVEMVYSLLSMLGTHDKDDMSRTLLAMSSSQDSCIAMRQSGCMPLLIQLLHGSDKDSSLLGKTRGSKSARARAAAALHNIVHSHPDDKRGRREARVLRLLEQIRAHCDQLRDSSEDEEEGAHTADIDHRPGPAIAALMKLSFDEEHRHAICTLGGLQAIAELLLVDHESHGNTTEQYNITMRRYACMALTNLTFGDGTNKALLCSMKTCMKALVSQLESPNEDLRQVAASVLRNLSWRADLASKRTLREVGTVPMLMKAAMEVEKESTLKSILSALWNLSAHCSENKADICAVPGSLGFLVSTLTYKSPTKTLAIVENGGGILRNISSQIAVREDYRKTLRHHGCLHILLKHLRSPSLTIVSNACGTLWNLSARCPEDQQALWDMGAVSMLRNLVHSKHKMISMGSAAALKNLLAAKPALAAIEADKYSKSNMPTLAVRKQRALEAEIDQNLAETCDNIESPQDSPGEQRKRIEHRRPKLIYAESNGMYGMNDLEHRRMIMQRHLYARNASADGAQMLQNKVCSPHHPVERASSQDSVGSVHSDLSHDRSQQPHPVFNKSAKLLHERPSVPAVAWQQGMQPQQQFGMDYQGSESFNERQGRHAVPANSRIMQVMQEVAIQAGIDPNSAGAEESKPHTSINGTPGKIRDVHKMQMFQRNMTSMNNKSRTAAGAAPAIQPAARSLTFSHPPPKHNKFLLHQDEEQDEPINYSMKYDENKGTEGKKDAGGAAETGFAYGPPAPKIGNFVGVNPGQPATPHKKPQRGPSVEPNPPPAAHAKTNMHKSHEFSKYSCSAYAETDLDNDEQPTNYSIRYAEQTDENTFNDQPINYSTRYTEEEQNCADCKLEEARRTNDRLEESANEDSMKTFYTEGTPYLSTATSMNDLSKAAPKPELKQHAHGCDAHSEGVSKEPAQPQKNFQSKFSDMSGSGSQSTDRKTVVAAPSASAVITSTPGQVTHASQAPSMPSLHSYNDSSGTMSPNEKPTTYCTEGTPVCFSRASSLSSLHSSEAKDSGSQQSKQDLALQSIDENNCLDTSQNQNDITVRSDPHDETLRPESANTTINSQGGESTTSGHNKTVTFDENNQVQETPLMFSRCSSLGSLSSFDTHSVHSSVISEYSRRASEVVSPSDLPDSPGGTMPPSPRHRKSPVKFELDAKCDSDAKAKHQQSLMETPKTATTVKQATVAEHRPNVTCQPPVLPSVKPGPDTVVPFAQEGTPEDFSCATSLSALTIDDEPNIKKDPGLRRMPLGQEEEEEPVIKPRLIEDLDDVHEPEPEVKPVPTDGALEKAKEVEQFSFEGDSSPSEGEEDILAQCISLAMPTNSKKKMKRSSSDTHLKKRAVPPRQMPETNVGSSVQATPQRPRWPNNFHQSTPKMSHSFCGPIHTINDFGETEDTVTKYATEGTPVHISHAGSFSDLSIISGKSDGDRAFNDLTKTPTDKLQVPSKATPRSQDKQVEDAGDAHSDVSSLSGDCEDLLSEAIEAAMPKGKPKKTVMDRKAEGAERKEKVKYQSRPFKDTKPPTAKIDPVRPVQQPLSKPCVTQDSVKTYAVEGTPINFSRATSLSDLSDNSGAEHLDDSGPLMTESVQLVNLPSTTAAGPSVSARTDGIQAEPLYAQPSCHDSPRVFGIEGTPISFSRNDSLSSLSCDEDLDLGNDKLTLRGQLGIDSPKGKQAMGVSKMSPQRLASPSPKRPTPKGASGGLRAKITVNLAKSQQQQQQNQMVKSGGPSPKLPEGDQPKTYAVEGTPMCFSTHSSLSSLNSDDHEALANRSPEGDESHTVQVADQSSMFKQEDTPMCFSQNSSLSSLSVESLSSEPTPSEKALLEECINAAMPKTKASRPSRMSRIPRTSPSGASDSKGKSRSPRSPDDGKDKTGKQKQGGVSPNNPSSSKCTSPDKAAACAKEQKELKNQGKCQDKDPLDVISPRSCNRKLDFSGSEQCVQSPNTSAPSLETVTDLSDNRYHDMEKSTSTVDEEKDGTEKEKELLAESNVSEKSDDNKLDMLELTDSLEKEAANVAFAISCCISSSDDIDAVSFPDMGVSGSTISMSTGSLGQSMTASGDKMLDSVDGKHDSTLNTTESSPASHNVSGDSRDGNTTVVAVDDAPEMPEISPEEERALEENANMIVNQLAIKRDFSSSTLDEDVFIENETISLVSNDYNSDTASDVSVTLSASSKTASEHISEASCSTVSQPTTAKPVPKVGPRIVKPLRKDLLKKKQEEENPPQDHDKGPKPIRGRRKSASSARSVSSLSSGRSGVTTRSDGVSKGIRPSLSPLKPGGVNPRNGGRSATPTRAASVGASVTKKTPTKASIGRGQTRSVSPATPSGARASPKPNRNGKSTTPSKSPGKQTSKPAGSKAGPVASTSKQGQASASAEKKESVERPKPPMKQGTFTKDSPSAISNAPQISPSVSNSDLTDPRGVPKSSSKSEIPIPANIKMREKRGSGGQSPARHSGSSTGSDGASKSQRNSGGTPPEAWSKALGGFNFIVDTSQENGYHAPYEQIQMQRHARHPPSAMMVKREHEKQEARVTEHTYSGKSEKSWGKSSTRSGVSKKESGSSTGKAPALPPKPGSKASGAEVIKKSSSNASIKSTGSRPSTPVGRKGSTESMTTPTKSTPGSGSTTPTKKGGPTNSGKKPVVSKIASLWRRDASPSATSTRSLSPSGTSRKMAEKPDVPPRSQSRSPKMARKQMTVPKSGSPSGAKSIVRKNSSSGSEKNSPREGLSRSSTYDKLPPADPDASNNNVKHVEDIHASRLSDPPSRAMVPSHATAGTSKMKPPPVPPRTTSVWRKVVPKPEQAASSGDETASNGSGHSISAPHWRKPGPEHIEQVNINGDIWIKRVHGSASDLSQPSTSGSELSLPGSTSTPTQNANPSGAMVRQATFPGARPLPAVPTSSEAAGKSGMDGKSTTATNAAIVSPFNYNPNPQKASSSQADVKLKVDTVAAAKSADKTAIPSPTKHMTKTEMLIARRRQSYLNSLKKDDSDSDDKKSSCLVTTV